MSRAATWPGRIPERRSNSRPVVSKTGSPPGLRRYWRRFPQPYREPTQTFSFRQESCSQDWKSTRPPRDASSWPDRVSDPYQVGYNLTLVLIRNRDYAAAIRAGEETLAAGHRKAEMYNLLAQAYEQSGQTKQAYDALRAATEIDPQDETNYLDLIALCLKHENYDLSLEIADIGRPARPRAHRLRLHRGVALVMKGRLEEAVKEFQTAGELLTERAPLPQVALGLALIQMDKHSEAIALLRRQTGLNPKDPRVFWLLGEALNRSGVQPGKRGGEGSGQRPGEVHSVGPAIAAIARVVGEDTAASRRGRPRG